MNGHTLAAASCSQSFTATPAGRIETAHQRLSEAINQLDLLEARLEHVLTPQIPNPANTVGPARPVQSAAADLCDRIDSLVGRIARLTERVEA